MPDWRMVYVILITWLFGVIFGGGGGGGGGIVLIGRGEDISFPWGVAFWGIVFQEEDFEQSLQNNTCISQVQISPKYQAVWCHLQPSPLPSLPYQSPGCLFQVNIYTCHKIMFVIILRDPYFTSSAFQWIPPFLQVYLNFFFSNIILNIYTVCIISIS